MAEVYLTTLYLLNDWKQLNVLNREIKENALWEDEWHGQLELAEKEGKNAQ